MVSLTAATFYVYQSFWSVLGSQALETPQLNFRNLNEPHLAWLLQPSPEPVEPDLAMHHGFLEPSPEYTAEPCWTWPGSAPKPLRPSPKPWTWLCTEARSLLRNLLRNPVEPDLALHQSLPHLLRNLLRNQGLPDLLRNLRQNPVEPDLAVHQSLPGLLRNPLNLTWLCTKASGTFFGTFSGTFSGTLSVEPDLALHQSLPDLLREPSGWPGCTKASQTFSGTFSGTLLDLTWLCTKASWNLLRDLLRNPVEPDLALHQSFPDLPPPRPSWEPSEPSPEPGWTWPGACTSAHQSYSGLKTTLAYAVGEEMYHFWKDFVFVSVYGTSKLAISCAGPSSAASRRESSHLSRAMPGTKCPKGSDVSNPIGQTHKTIWKELKRSVSKLWSQQAFVYGSTATATGGRTRGKSRNLSCRKCRARPGARQ